LLPQRKDPMISYTFIRLVFGFAALVRSNEGFVVLTPGFPVAVPNTGCVLVLGRAGADRGYMLRSATVKYFENGGEVQTANDRVPRGWDLWHDHFEVNSRHYVPGSYRDRESRAGEHETRIRSTTVIAR